MRRPVLLCLLALLAAPAPAHAAERFWPDRGYALQWGLHGPFGIRAEPAWIEAARRGGSGGRGVRVAVVDSGIAYRREGRWRRSPDLAGARITPGHDFVDGDRRPVDESGHGTYVASAIAAQPNGIGMVGVAYRAELLPVRVVDGEDGSTERAIAAGIAYAVRRKADVINLSVQGPYDSLSLRGSSIARSGPIRRAIQAALDAGVVVVAAAGNDDQGDIPGRALSGVIFVGATTARGCRAAYSNRGPGLDLVAPGGGPDAAGPGTPGCRQDAPNSESPVLSFRRSAPRSFLVRDDLVGTSMAAPLVTGTVALLLASGVLGEDPTPAAVERRLKATARDLGEPGPDRRFGAGLLDAGAALSGRR